LSALRLSGLEMSGASYAPRLISNTRCRCGISSVGVRRPQRGRWSAVIRYRLGLLSLEEALAKLSKRLGLRIRAVILPYANAAIDVDSIADLMLVKGALEKAAVEDA